MSKSLKEGMTPLHWAAERNHADTADHLISHGADINIKDNNDMTPLHWVSDRNNPDAAALLISKGTEINIKDKKKQTPLHRAAMRGHTLIASELISKRAEINSRDDNDMTPLHLAVEGSHSGVAELLISERADINIKDMNGMTPLHLAAQNCLSDTAAILISNGADINITDNNRQTPLHRAALGGQTYIAAQLISSGAEINIRDENGKTAKDFVEKIKQQKFKEEHEQVLKELIFLGMGTADEFQDILKEGTYKCFWNRIYLVGPYSVGKSTLARILVGEPMPTEREPTDGIWIYMGRAGMDVEKKKWIFFPKGTAIKEILAGLLMSITNERSKITPLGRNNSNKEPAQLEILQNVKPAPVNKQPAVATINRDQTQGKRDDIIKHQPAMPATPKNHQSEKLAVYIPQRIQVKDDIRPGPRNDKASEKMSEIQKPVTSITNTKIHDLLIHSIKDGKYKQRIIPIDIWDFGGQKDYYMTHQLFITSRGIYVLMFNDSDDIHKIMNDLSFLPGHFGRPTVAVYLLHWVNSILTYCKRTDDGFPQIIFVATHKDKIPKNKIEFKRKKLMDSISELFKSHAGLKHLEFKPLIFINTLDNKDAEIDLIQSHLIEKAVKHPRWGEQMPTSWVPLELQLAEKAEEGTNVIKREEIQTMNAQNTPMVLSEKQLNTFLKVQHSLGKLLYFDEAKLRDFIIINPAYMVEVLRSVVTEKQFWPKGEVYTRVLEQMQKTGKIRRDDIHLLWSQKHFQHILPHADHMVELLVHLDILVAPWTTFEDVMNSANTPTVTSDRYFLVPCMITESNSSRYIQDFCVPKKTIVLAYTFIDEIIPPALAYRFLGSFMTMWDLKIYKGRRMLFSDLAVVEINDNHSITVQVQGNRIVVSLVHSYRKEDIVGTLASSVQECLTASVHRISEFYSTLSGDGGTPQETEDGLKTANVTIPFNIEFGVLCHKGIFQNTWSICYFAQRELSQPSWTCPVHNTKHDLQSLRLWFSEKIQLGRCLNSCTGLGILELGVSPLDKHLCRFVRMLDITTCRELFIHLGHTLKDWKQIEYQFQRDNPINVMFTALMKWKDRQPTPTFGMLRNALNECSEDVHILCQVFSDISPDTPELTEEMLMKRPTYKALQCVLDHIGDSVMELGVELGLDFTQIISIQYEYKNKLSDQARAVLKHWMEKSRETPTVRTIVQALYRIGKINCIHKI